MKHEETPKLEMLELSTVSSHGIIRDKVASAFNYNISVFTPEFWIPLGVGR